MALGHFHERVGESPRREKDFGTSGSKKSGFVSEIWSFEVGIIHGKILVLFKCPLFVLVFKGLNSSVISPNYQ